MLGDRFYVPPAARQQQKTWRSRDSAGSPWNTTESKSVSRIEMLENGRGSESSDDQRDSNVCFTYAGTRYGNLDQFLRATAPTVRAQYFSKTIMRGWRTLDIEFHFFYTLGDLWESFKEWSAYGAGVPLMLNGRDSIIQYYVPYLSAIQLYADSPNSISSNPRQLGEESGFESYIDTSSDGSSRNDCDKILRSSKKAWSWHYPSDEASIPVLDSLFSRETPSINQKVFSSRHGDMYNSPRNCLLYEFFEESSPYIRQPLADKVMDLACQFPKLKTLRSCNLLPCSWISVAWYPIYRIPTGPTLQDLDTCFLTFHTLSSPFKGSKSGFAHEGIHASSAAALEQIWILPAFGLASYKFKSSVWTTPGGYEHQRAASLFQAANNWLRILRVNHPDFSFFVSHGSHWGQE